MSTIIIKNSGTPGNQPATLNEGELAINTTDGKIYYGSTGGVKQFSGGGGGSTDTGSLASTGSNTFKGDQIISGSLTVTGSTTLTGLTTATQTNVVGIDANGQLYKQSATAASVFPYTGSAAITGSLTVTGSVNITGSTTQTGNNTLTGNTVLSGSINISGSQTFNGTSTSTGTQIVTGSLLTSGSNTLIGTTTLTGSLNVTGSTTQVGNNNLYGNTTLSGSIIISGSTTVPSTPTIKVYGDMETNGVIKFLAVDKNIDTTISGSYIYVSGSTNDLYFSQNGAGFNNNVRLRWLEGGALYTGLLRGGIISSTPGTTTFNITSGSGLIVTMNASTASEPYPTVQYISWPNFTAQPIQYSGSAKITYLGISSAGTVIQQTVPWGTSDINQWDNSISLGVVLHLSGSVSTGVFNSPQISYGGQQKTDDFFRAFGPLKISGHTLQASGSTLGIQKTGGTSYREGANYVLNANHPSTVIENAISTSKIYRYYLSGSTPIIDTGVANAGYTVIDPTQYVDTTTGQLVTVTGNNSNNWRWTIQRVFWVPNSPTNAFIVYYGNAEYSTLVDVKNAIDTEPFSEAPNTAQNAIFIGYILVRKGCTDLSDTTGTNAVLVQGGLFRNVGGNGGSGTAAATSLGSLSDVSLTNTTKGDLLVYGAAGDGQWNNAKQLTGSYGLTGSLTVTQNISASSFTGSLQGTASWATNFVSASNYVLNSATSSFVTNSQTSSFVLNSQTSSFVTNAQTSSFVTNSQTSSFATTGSNQFNGNQTITGSLTVITGSSIEFQVTNTGVKIGNTINDTHTITGSLNISSSAAVVSSTEIGYLSGVTFPIQNQLNAAPYYAYQTLGSAAKSVSLTTPNINNISVAAALVNNNARFVALYLPSASVITGVKWFVAALGVYTSNNYNGVGLYTISAGTLNCVASSSNNGNIWSGSLQTVSTWTSQSFGSTYSAQPGIYYVGLLYNSSAQTTAPSLGGGPTSVNAAINSFDFTNSYKIIGSVAANTLPTSQASSGLATGTNLSYAVYLY
jgi:hypothetical protein